MKAIILLFQLVLLLLPFMNKTFAQQSEFELGFSNPVKLVPLTYEINEDAIAEAYFPRGKIISYASPYDEQIDGYASDLYKTDEKTHDTKIIAERYISRELMTDGNNIYGTLDFDILFYEYKTAPSPFAGVNMLTFGIGIFLGIPSGIGISKVESELSIYDVNNKLIASYTGIGTDKFSTGLYYRKDQRSSNRDAIKDALEKINAQVMADVDLVNTKLLAGTVK